MHFKLKDIFLRNVFEFDLRRMCCSNAVSLRSCPQAYEKAGYVQANAGGSCFDRPNVLQKQNIKVNCVCTVSSEQPYGLRDGELSVYVTNIRSCSVSVTSQNHHIINLQKLIWTMSQNRK